MKSAVETLNPTRVRLTVEVPFEELKDSLDAAYKKINQQVTVKGFRKGKIPARVIDQRFGRGAVLEEAVNDALPKFYTEAVNEAELSPLGQPDVDITELKDGETLNFTAEVDVRPALEIPDYSGIEVEVDAVEVTDEDVEKSVEQLRERFASTTPVERAAQDGDVVTIDLQAKVDGEVLEDGIANGVSYTIGSGELLDGIDDAVKGLSAGEEATFTSELKGGSAAGKGGRGHRQGHPGRRPRTAGAGRRVRAAGLRVRHPEELKAGQPQAPRQHEAVRPGHAGPGARPGEAAGAVRSRSPRSSSRTRSTPASTTWSTTSSARWASPSTSTWRSRARPPRSSRTRPGEAAVKGIKTQFVLDELVKKEQLNVNQEELTAHLMRRAASSGMSPDQFAQASRRGRPGAAAGRRGRPW